MNVWTYWEGPRLPYIDTCLASVARVCDTPGVNFCIVTPETLFNFIPKDSIPSNFFRLEQPGLSADYIRASLLARHGGWWWDADTIGLHNPLELVEQYPDAEMIYTSWPTPPKRVLNGYIYAREGSLLAKEWLKQADSLLKHSFGKAGIWTGLGEKVLTPLLNDHPDCKKVDYRTFLPINIDQEVVRFFEPTNFRSYIKDYTICYGLNHSWFLHRKREEVSLAPKRWKSSSLLFHKLLHYAETCLILNQSVTTLPTAVRNPKVSICLATYNRDPNVLRQVLNSIFRQTPPFDFEVIVCDDGTHDKKGHPDHRVQEICKQYPIQYHRIDRSPGFKNPCVPRNITYRAARGDIIIAQSDEVVHKSPDAIEKLVKELEEHPNSFVIATVNACAPNGKPWSIYTGKKRQKPWFFLGALWRRHLYAVGGNDEDFANGPAFDDEWFARCLQRGLGLTPLFTASVVGHHLYHPPSSSKHTAKPNQEIGRKKTEKAELTKVWCSSGGPWFYSDALSPALIAEETNTSNKETNKLKETTSRINSVVVCVEYDDFLSITLPLNKKHFHQTLIVTSPTDTRTQEVAHRMGCKCLITDVFYAKGAWFNKGAAIEQAFDNLGREGWLCYWDADIVMPEKLLLENPDERFLYCPYRRVLEDPAEFSLNLNWSRLVKNPMENEFPGYFHLFHTRSAGVPPWYSTHWNHAGGCDSDFEAVYQRKKCVRRLESDVLHLGKVSVPPDKATNNPSKEFFGRVGANWCGRTTPRIDAEQSSELVPQRSKLVSSMTDARIKLGKTALIKEREGNIPRRISFLWSGSMSWLRWVCLETFVKLNPDWDVRVYLPTTKPVKKCWKADADDDHAYTGPDYRDRIPESVTRHDFTPPPNMPSPQMCGWFRWQVLSKGGGFFADMDFIWVKPLQGIWEQICDADAMFCLESGYLAVGFMASCPHCALFEDLAISREPQANIEHQFYGVDWVYKFSGVRRPFKPKSSPGQLVLDKLRGHYSDNGKGKSVKILDIPDYTVYPFDWRQIDTMWNSNVPVDGRVTALHWFGGARTSRTCSHRLTESNWKDTDNTIKNYLERVL